MDSSIAYCGAVQMETKKMVTISRYRWGEMEEGLRFFEQDFSCKTTHQVWKTIVLGKWDGPKEFYDNF